MRACGACLRRSQHDGSINCNCRGVEKKGADPACISYVEEGGGSNNAYLLEVSLVPVFKLHEVEKHRQSRLPQLRVRNKGHL